MRKKLFILTGVLVVGVAQWMVISRWANPQRRPAQVEDLPNLPLSRKQLVAGVPAQRKRIDDFIDQTGQYQNFDELIDGLSDPLDADFDILQGASMMSSDLVPEGQF